jgi:HEPN domain-containing protein
MSVNLPRQWLERASEDLDVAQLVLEEEYFAHVCFLAQQAIEKALKGYLLQHTGTYPKTHRLLELLASCTTQAVLQSTPRLHNSCHTAQWLTSIIHRHATPMRSLGVDLPAHPANQKRVKR